VALLWALPYGRVVLVSQTLAVALGARFLTHSEVIDTIAADNMHCEEEREAARAFATRAREALIDGSVASPAAEQLCARISDVSGPRFASTAAAASAAVGEVAFPSEPSDFRDLVAMELPPFYISPDCSACVLAGRDAPVVPKFILVRMSRDAIEVASPPQPVAPPVSPVEIARQMQASLDAALAAGRAQLWRAYVTASSGTPNIAYYEMDMSLRQERVVSTSLPSSLSRVPVLLVRWCDGVEAVVQELWKHMRMEAPGGRERRV
jgi:hypothetical protein